MDVETEIRNIKDRNGRVEQDKAWEISFARRFFIALSTYIVAGIWLLTIKDSLPWLKALVPAGGYILSTLSLPFVRKTWARSKASGRAQ
ncbi:MAG: hypothetical protein WC250_01285 [Candidatus Paceibacterota bacterium]|jgi:hypothetical protein